MSTSVARPALSGEIIEPVEVTARRDAALVLALLGAKRIVSLERCIGLGRAQERQLAAALRAAGQRAVVICNRHALSDHEEAMGIEAVTPQAVRRNAVDLGRYDVVVLGDAFPEEYRNISDRLADYPGKVVDVGPHFGPRVPDVRFGDGAARAQRPLIRHLEAPMDRTSYTRLVGHFEEVFEAAKDAARRGAPEDVALLLSVVEAQKDRLIRVMAVLDTIANTSLDDEAAENAARGLRREVKWLAQAQPDEGTPLERELGVRAVLDAAFGVRADPGAEPTDSGPKPR
jgi:hypothetical protein